MQRTPKQVDDTYWEVYEHAPGFAWWIGLARDADGWRWAAACFFGEPGEKGPIERKGPAFLTRDTARRRALAALEAALRPNAGCPDYLYRDALYQSVVSELDL